MKDYYKILGLTKNASPRDVRDAYRRRVSSCHPDKFVDPDEKAQAEEIAKDVNEAYQVLKNPQKRTRYDRKRTRSVKFGSERHKNARPFPTQPVNAAPVWPMDEPEAPQHIPQPARRHAGINHLHESFYASSGDVLQIQLAQAANVMLFDEFNYIRYQRGMAFQYYGGYVRVSPVTLKVPYPGSWHLVVDLGGQDGLIQAQARLYRSRWW